MKTPLTILVALAMLSSAASSRAQDQHQHGGTEPERLGTVHFETSCKADVRTEFDRGVALLHSFWFVASLKSFETVAAADPSCGMAWWGAALSYWGNPFVALRAPKVLEDGKAAIDKGLAAGAATERERAYIAAVAELYRDVATRDHRTRTLAYEKAMQAIAEKYPADTEAATFYALSLDQTALPTDKTYANQLKAAAILEKLFKTQPDHPGLAHYIIHTYDTPALAPKGLEAARRYATIAPSAPHALHMPSHTFTRVGSWRESIDANIKSADAAARDNALSEVLHALDYETYAYLQLAQDQGAHKIVESLDDVARRFDPTKMGNAAPGLAGDFALAAMPARYALERAAWREAAALTPRATAFPFVAAMTHYARALGAARTGDAAAARKEAEKLGELRAAAEATKDAYWTEQVEIQRQVASAWATWAEGRKDEALRALASAADREDATDKSAVTPGPLKPARELLGEMLLAANRPADALVAFEATVKKEPNRFWGVYGAGRAAELAGNRDKASGYYTELVNLCRDADSPLRAELSAARAFVGRTE
jgi:hypothetical protein